MHLNFPVLGDVEPRHWVIRARRFQRAHCYHLPEFVTKEEWRKNKYSSLVIYALEDDAIKLFRNVWHVIQLSGSNTGLSKKMDGIWNRYNLKSTGRIYTFGVLKCSEKFKVLDIL